MAELLRAHVETEELSPFELVLRRAFARRRLSGRAPLALVHDAAEAMSLRQLQLAAPFDDAFIRRVVDDVLLPLLRPKSRRR